MDKTRKQILLFIMIILIGVGYALNEYVFAPKKLLIDEKVKLVQANKQKLRLLKSESSEVAELNGEVAKLKLTADTIGDFAVTDIDTPQLIYDFYNSCKNYGIKGEDLVFQLADNNTTADKASTGTTSNSSSGATNQSANTTPSTTTTSKTGDTTKSTSANDLVKLTIELKVSGDKNMVEEYIRKLDTITSRKINVQSVKLEATIAQVVSNDTTASSGEVNTTNTTNTPITTDTLAEPVTDQVTADIIFNQYIYTEDKDIIRSSNYSFYTGNIGFSNFSDMFK